MSNLESNTAAEQPKLIVIDGVCYGGSTPHTAESLKAWEEAMRPVFREVLADFEKAAAGWDKLMAEYRQKMADLDAASDRPDVESWKRSHFISAIEEIDAQKALIERLIAEYRGKLAGLDN